MEKQKQPSKHSSNQHVNVSFSDANGESVNSCTEYEVGHNLTKKKKTKVMKLSWSVAVIFDFFAPEGGGSFLLVRVAAVATMVGFADGPLKNIIEELVKLELQAMGLIRARAVQMRTIIGGGNGGTNLGHLFQFAADQFSDAGALLSAQHIFVPPFSNLIILRSFENSYIPENPRTPKPYLNVFETKQKNVHMCNFFLHICKAFEKKVVFSEICFCDRACI
ncbi:hypothetical protein LXL04_027519 [Taraxacum kok-saghyz]